MTVTPAILQFTMMKSNTAVDDVWELIKKHTENVTFKIEYEMESLYASMEKQNQDMASIQKDLIKRLEDGIASLEDHVTDLEQTYITTDGMCSPIGLENGDSGDLYFDSDAIIDDACSTSEFDSEGDSNSSNSLEGSLESLTLGGNTQLYADNKERLNSVEINGIPIIDDDIDLQGTICDVLEQIGVHVELCDFEECYRLKESTGQSGLLPIVCRFVNRKICLAALKNRRYLKNVNVENVNSNQLFISDYLCWYYKKLAAKCRRLKKSRKITDTWTFKGIVKIRLLNGSVKCIRHQVDLDKMFPNFTYF